MAQEGVDRQYSVDSSPASVQIQVFCYTLHSFWSAFASVAHFFSDFNQSKNLRFKDLLLRISEENLSVALSSKYEKMLNEFLEVF